LCPLVTPFKLAEALLRAYKNGTKEQDIVGHKEKLVVLLEGLDCQNIDELIEKLPEHLKAIGITIAKYTKIGAESDIVLIKKALNID